MPTVEESVVINRPKAEVFAYMQDPTKTTRYNSNLVEFDKISDGPAGKGTQYRGVAKVAGRKIAWTSGLRFRSTLGRYRETRGGRRPIAGGTGWFDSLCRG